MRELPVDVGEKRLDVGHGTVRVVGCRQVASVGYDDDAAVRNQRCNVARTVIGQHVTFCPTKHKSGDADLPGVVVEAVEDVPPAVSGVPLAGPDPTETVLPDPPAVGALPQVAGEAGRTCSRLPRRVLRDRRSGLLQ